MKRLINKTAFKYIFKDWEDKNIDLWNEPWFDGTPVRNDSEKYWTMLVIKKKKMTYVTLNKIQDLQNKTFQMIIDSTIDFKKEQFKEQMKRTPDPKVKIKSEIKNIKKFFLQNQKVYDEVIKPVRIRGIKKGAIYITAQQYKDVVLNNERKIAFYEPVNDNNIDSRVIDCDLPFAHEWIYCKVEVCVKWKKYLESELKTFQPQPTDKQKPKLIEKSITLKIDIIKELHKELKGYFPNKEKELLKALNGEQLTELLLFPHNQNKFVEVFRRLKYNGFILNSDTEIKDWICSTFVFKKKGLTKPQLFNKSTVWSNLNKGRGEPTKKERICIVNWLPYKNPLQLKSEAEKEKL